MKAIIFDVDGTIIDTESVQLKALQQVAKQRGLHYSMDDLRIVFGLPGRIGLERLGIEDVEQTLADWEEAIEAFQDEMTLFDRMQELIEMLHKQGYALGIVTSKTKKQFDTEVVPFGIHTYFDAIVVADDTEKHKPHPDPLQHCMAQLNVEPSDTLYIGDSIFDYECALAAKASFGVATWGATQASQMVEATYHFETAADVIKQFNKEA